METDEIKENQQEETEEVLPESARRSQKEMIVREIIEWAGVIITALAISLFLNFCIIVNARVPSASMENTIMTGDRLVGFRLSYVFDEPQRGDVIIFRYPDNEKILYIKRIIGLPGETVVIKDGSVYINDEPLPEPYLTVEMAGEFGPYEVPRDHYFMLGDNRNNSADSRFWKNTYLDRKKIVGKALFKYFPSPGAIRSAEYSVK